MKPIVLIPTLHPAKLEQCHLEYLPKDWNLYILSEEDSWPKAINRMVRETEGDILIMDDDIILQPDTFKDFDQWIEQGDLIGFKLLYPPTEPVEGSQNGAIKIQHVGGMFFWQGGGYSVGIMGRGEEDRGQYDQAAYVPHVTMSLCYVKRIVWEMAGLVTEWPGLQFEDVDFTCRALSYGFRVLYIPNAAYHRESETLKELPDYEKRMSQNGQLFGGKWLVNQMWQDFVARHYPGGRKVLVL